MIYLMSLNQFPLIKHFYSVTRNTVWQIADPDHILIFIKEGCCSIALDNEEYILQSGDIFFVPCNHAYTRRSINGTMCTMTYIHFSLPLEIEQIDPPSLYKRITDAKNALDNQILNGAPRLSYQNNIYLQNRTSPPPNKHVFQMIDDIQLFSTKRQLMCGLQSSITLCGILSSLSQCTIDSISNDSTLKSPSIIPSNLKKAIRYIRNHYAENIRLEDIASYCSVSKQQLTRYFQAAFHTTPIAYLTDYRIAKAKDLLFNHPQLSITEISDELGFNNSHYFSTVFQKTTGESPSEYRKRTSIPPVSAD